MRSNQRGARRWNPSPWRVRAVRAAMFGVPVAAVIAVSVVFATLSDRPSTLGPQVLWWLGLTVSATGAAFVSRPVVQRLAPLHFIYQLNLAFPEHAPKRFGTALRRSGVRELERRLALGGSIGDTPQQAAEHMIALLARLTHHDRLTRGHCERVAAYTSMIADELAMSDADKDQLRWAALIHDVGKLNVAATLLNKTTPPSAGDWRELRRHPAAARQFVGPLRPWLGNAVLAASQHHEHWNGGGYPEGLQTDQISTAGRIVAVADAYDVMTSHRSYKVAYPVASAQAELARGAGTQFDPQVVRAFLAIPRHRLTAIAGPLAWVSEHPRLSQAVSQAASSTYQAAAATVAAAAAVAMATVGVLGVSTTAAVADAAPDPDPTAVTSVPAPPEMDNDQADNLEVSDGIIALPEASGPGPADVSESAVLDPEPVDAGVERVAGSETDPAPAQVPAPPVDPQRPPEEGARAPSQTEGPTPATNQTPTIGTGYKVATGAALALADTAWGLASNEWIYVISGVSAFDYDEPVAALSPATRIDGGRGEPMVLANTGPLCSVRLRGLASSGTAQLGFQLRLDREVVAVIAATDPLGLSGFSADVADLEPGELEAGDWVELEPAPQSGGTIVTGQFTSSADDTFGDIDEIVLWTTCE